MSNLRTVNGPHSFLIWHVCLLFDYYYTIFYIIAMISLHVYKYMGLMYPPSVWTMELFGLLMLAGIQAVRISIGIHANRCESSTDTIIFMILTIPVAYIILHYTLLGTYVLLIEILFSVVPLVLFTPIELIISFIAWR